MYMPLLVFLAIFDSIWITTKPDRALEGPILKMSKGLVQLFLIFLGEFGWQ